jgi:hypothetical protein
VQTAVSHPETLLAATRHIRVHTSRKRSPIHALLEEAGGDALRRFSSTSHLVWGYVPLTGVAAYVPPGFHPL